MAASGAVWCLRAGSAAREVEEVVRAHLFATHPPRRGFVGVRPWWELAEPSQGVACCAVWSGAGASAVKMR